GSNSINIVVTAQDGVTRQTYTVTVTREKAPQVISFTLPATKTFGDPNFPLNAISSNPTILVTYTSDNPSVAAIVNGNIHILGTGTVNITASQAGNANYLAAADVIKTITVMPKSQTISFFPLPQKIYGDASFTLNASNFSGLPLTYSSSDISIASVNGAVVNIHKAGTVTITASQPGNANYTAANPVSQTLIINPKTLTARLVGTVSKIYDGNINAVFTGTNFSLSGQVSTDDVALNYPLIGTYYGRSVNAVKVVGASGLSLTGSDKANYVLSSTNIFDYVGVITPAPVQVNLIGTVAKTYDGTNTATLTAANYQLSGLMNTAEQVTFNKPANGTYDNSNTGNNKTVAVSGIALSGLDANNYVLAAANSSANIGSINPKMLTVTADNQSRIYNAPNSALTVSYSGFANGETVASLTTLPTLSTTATADAPVGNYPITASGASSSNYNFTYVNGVLTIGQSGNVITFNAIPNKTYGDADFRLNATASSGLNVSFVSNNPSVATVDQTGNVHILSAGNTTITAAQTGNNNYAAAVSVDQILSVNKASLTITAEDKTKTYGDVNPPLTYTYTGFVNGETDAVLTTKPQINTTATATSANGNYPITASGAGSSDYNFTYVNGVLTVGQSGNVITFNAIPNKTYGDADFRLNATASSGLEVHYTSSNPAVATVDLGGNVHLLSAGNTTITASQTGNNNYNAAVNVNQILSVNKALLTITAEDKTRNYGLINPAFTATYTGFVNGETASVLIVQPTISTNATATSPAGNYQIMASNAAAANYEIAYVPGTLTVKQTALNSLTLSPENVYENQPAGTLAGTLTAVSADPNAVFTYSFSGGNAVNDNASFSILGNKLFTAAAFDYEAKSNYSVQIRATDAHGLYLDQTINIQIRDVNEAPTLAAISNQTGCYSTSTQNLQLSGIGAGPESNQTVTLSVQTDRPELFNNLQISSAANGKATLTYQLATAGTAKMTVTVQDNGGTANGGTDHFSQTFTLTANALSSATIAAEKTKISKGETITLKASGGSVYRWDNRAGIISSLTAAEIQIRPAQTTTYQVLVSNALGCSSTASVTVEVEDDYAMLQPANLLTPNGDGKNDTWVVKNLDLYPENSVTIFDKGGRQLLHVQHYQNDWSGTFQGAPLTEGTYYYVLDFGPGKAPMKGFFSILRSR
ncbi:MAG: T9SS type B sorting domain-containing protein, partial [Sphingobacteriaceae bacterium]